MGGAGSLTGRCPSRLLDDSPSSADELGPHGRIATAIASVVQDDTGGKAIALTGTWGSGKSTVVNLIESATVDGGPPTHVFVFDAWVHEGDPLRIAFLRSLNSWLNRKFSVDQEDELQELENRVQTETEEIKPQVSRLDALMLLWIALVPMSYWILSNAPESDWKWLVWIGVPVVAFGPLLTLLGWTLLSKGKDKAPRLASLLFRRQPSAVTVRTVRSPDSTTIEFQGQFERLIGEALKGSEDRIVVVIDNLDRVDPASAIKAWGTIQSVFDSAANDHEWSSRFWILVPHDPDAMEAIWETREASPASEFLSKTFQVSFDVPPPQLGDWKRFLLDRLAEALPMHHAEGNAVYLEAYYWSTASAWSPTPRNIKRFINRLTAIHLQWCSEGAPIHLQARLALTGSATRIEDGTIVTPGIAAPPDDEEARWIAAMLLNVPAAESIAALISPTVETALASGDANRLSKLVDTPAELAVVEAIVAGHIRTRDWSTVTEISLAASAVEGLDAAFDADNDEISAIRRSLRRGLSRMPDMVDLGSSRPSALALLIETAPESERSPLARDLLQRSVTSLPDEQGRPAFAGQLLALISLLAVFIPQEELSQVCALNGEPEEIARLLRTVATESDSELALRALHPVSHSALQGFAGLVDAGDFDDAALTALESVVAYASTGPDASVWDPTPVTERIVERLKSEANGETIAPLIGALVLLKDSEPAPKVPWDDLRGVLAHHFYILRQGGDLDSAAQCAVLSLLIDPAATAAPSVLGQSNNGQSELVQTIQNPAGSKPQVAAIAAAAEALRRTQHLVESLLEGDRGALAVAIAAGQVDSDEWPLRFPSLIEHYDQFLTHMELPALTRLLGRFNADGAFVDYLGEEGLTENVAQASIAALRADPDEPLARAIKPHLKGLTEEDWVSDLEGPRTMLELAKVIGEVGVPAGINKRLGDPARDQLVGILAGGDPASMLSAEELQPVLGPGTLKALLTDVLKGLKDAQRGPAVLKEYGDLLIDQGVVQENAEVVVGKAGPGIVGRGNADELAWLTRAMRSLDSASRSGPDAGALVAAIQSRRSEVDGPTQTALDAISDLL